MAYGYGVLPAEQALFMFVRSVIDLVVSFPQTKWRSNAHLLLTDHIKRGGSQFVCILFLCLLC